MPESKSEVSDRSVQKRPRYRTLAVIDTLMGIGCSALGVYLLYLMRTPEVQKEKGAVTGLGIAVAIFLPVGVLYLAGAVGLFKGWRWGWWIGFLVSCAGAFAFGYDVVTDWKHSDSDDVSFAACALAMVLVHLMQPTVRFMRGRRRGKSSAPEAAVG